MACICGKITSMLTRSGRMDVMTVHVEAAPAPGAANALARAVSANELASHIKNVVGVTAKIEVEDQGAVERSSGKARRVVDNRSIV